MKYWDFFSRQAGKPSGLFGRWYMARLFDRGNDRLNRLMETQVAAQNGQRILEIGCGTGKLLGRLASAVGNGLVEGVEYSRTMAKLARKNNAQAIKAGRAEIQEGDFNALPLPENAYSAICTCNTIYFWPEPLATLRKAHRLLAPGGLLAVAFEDKARMEAKPISQEVFRLHARDEVKELLIQAGFGPGVEIREAEGDPPGFCCAVARK